MTKATVGNSSSISSVFSLFTQLSCFVLLCFFYLFSYAASSEAVDREGKPVCAFVTFNDEVSRNLVLEIYYHGSSMAWFFCADKIGIFKGRALMVNKAPEPSRLLWENLQYSGLQRSIRTFLTTAYILVFIAFNIGVTFASRILQQTTLQSGGIGECPSHWSSLPSEEQLQLVTENSDYLHCYCNLHANESKCFLLSFYTKVSLSLSLYH